VVAEITSLNRLSKQSLAALKRRLVASLCSDVDLNSAVRIASRISPNVAKLLEAGGGRLLRGFSVYEDAVKTLFTTNASWKFTQMMVENLILECGVDGAFPTPLGVLELSEKQLRKRCRIGYRAAYLRKITEWFKDDPNRRIPKKLHGLGPYGMAHLRALYGHLGEIPIDSEVRSYCRDEFGFNTDHEIRENFEEWGEYQFLGYKLERITKNANWIGD